METLAKNWRIADGNVEDHRSGRVVFEDGVGQEIRLESHRCDASTACRDAWDTGVSRRSLADDADESMRRRNVGRGRCAI